MRALQSHMIMSCTIEDIWRPLASYSVAVKNDNCRQWKLLLVNHYILEECISRVTGSNGSVV